MIISVASGKGGTGKTTIAVNLALSLDNVQLLDCDVEEPNAALFLKPLITQQISAFIPVPIVDKSKCTYCGKCKDICVYNAIAVFSLKEKSKGNILFFPNLCHGCGACQYLCPEKAISEENREIGIIEIGFTGKTQFVQGKLNIGEAMAPPLIRQVKKLIEPDKTVIIDAPPGTSCPVITAVKDTDYCILATEPTPFGLNDLSLAVEALRKLKIPFGVVINRSDFGDNKTENYCVGQNIPIIMKIPFKREIAQAYSKGALIIDIYPEYKDRFNELYKTIESINSKAVME